MAVKPNRKNNDPIPTKPDDSQTGPVIEYFGDGAENVKFEADPKAKTIHVFNDGRILTFY